MQTMPKRKRAITLAGGGPAAGLHIGVLLRLDEINANLEGHNEPPLEFEVWGLSCIGAWVGVVYHQFPDNKAERTYQFFRDNVFRDDAEYKNFPINRAFGPDIEGFHEAWVRYISDYKSYENLVLPERITAAALNWSALWLDPSRLWRDGDRNALLLNDWLAVNPVSRFLTSLMFLSEINGLTKILYEKSSFLDAITFDNLFRPDAPHIYHNAWDLTTNGGRMQLFDNKGLNQKYKPITPQSVCACSALPYIEQTVKIRHAGAQQDIEYCEGALVDTVNFKDLLEDHPEIEEVWVSRIVDVAQVKSPKNITDGISNLCMLFAGELGDNDVKLFRQHVRKRRLRKPRVIEIPVAQVNPTINFAWSHENLHDGIQAGKNALDQALNRY